MSGKKLYLLIALAIIIICLFFYIFFHRDKLPAENGEENSKQIKTGSEIVFPVSVQPVIRENLILWITSGGLARPAREAEIVTQISGRMDTLAVHNGKTVTRGQMLARIDPSEARIALRQAENGLLACRINYNIIKTAPDAQIGSRPDHVRKQLDSLTAAYKLAEEQHLSGELDDERLQRIRRNYESLLSYRDFDRDDVVANKCGLDAALVSYEQARLHLSYCTLTAPFNGLVADCELGQGSCYLAQNFKCMKIVDLSSITVVAEVTETQLARLAIGHQAEVRLVAFPQEVFYGRVCEINPYVDLEKRIAKVGIQVNNPAGRIKPGMYSSVRIQGNVVNNAVIVPRAALVMRDNRPVIFLTQNGLAKWNYVELGAENEDYYQILKGAAAGDTVVVDGNYNLAHDARIRVNK
jgi:RND family efflux transporter MFP subunit